MKSLRWLEKRQQAQDKAEATHERERQKAEAALEQEQRDAKALLDASSAKNRNILIFFLLFCTYVLVTTVSTTDMQLLVPNSSLHLPLLGIGLPLFGYYLIVPVLVITFHLNILLNLHEHLKKLERWLDASGNRDEHTRLLLPFVVDFAFTTRPGEFNRLLFSSMYLFIVYVFPFVVLSAISIRFGDYQSVRMSSFHLLLLLFDLFLLGYYHRKIPETFKKQRSWKLYLISFFCCAPMVVLIFNQVNLILLVTLAVYPKSEKVPLVASWKSESLWDMLDSLGMSDYLMDGVSPFPHLTFSPLQPIPLLDLRQVNSYRDFLGDTELFEDTETRIAYTPSLDLRKRSLRWINLVGAFIPNTTFYQAKMERANLHMAQMMGANLIEAQMMGARLSGAQMKGANLDRAQMMGADLSEAQMEGAYLTGAQMKDAEFFEARLVGAYLRWAKMEGANLYRAQMVGANLRDAQMVGADLRGAQMMGANLSGAQMMGADLRGAQMMGANLSGAQMMGADLRGAQMEGAYLRKTHLLGLIAEKTNWTGAYIIDIDYNKKPDWDALRKKGPKKIKVKEEFLKRIDQAQGAVDAMHKEKRLQADFSEYQDKKAWRESLFRVSQKSTIIAKGVFRHLIYDDRHSTAWLLKQWKKEQPEVYRQLLDDGVFGLYLEAFKRKSALSQREYDVMLKDVQDADARREIRSQHLKNFR